MVIATPKKTINTLVEDIYDLVFEGKVASKENLELFGKGCMEAIASALAQGCKTNRTTLRMSSIGTPNRKLFYSLKGYEVKPLAPTQAISFMYGHLIEQMLLFLARESGHIVTDEQKEVNLEGVLGHIDCKIDGVLVDAKGMSNYGFMKFLTGQILKKDDFGYIPQISGYAQALDAKAAAFFAFNKERGTLTLFVLDDMDLMNARGRIKEVKEVLSKDEVPERCYSDIADGKAGNRILDRPCEWCPFKYECWKDANGGQGLRKFKYSDGFTYFTNIEKEPKVQEVFEDNGETKEEIVPETEV